MRIVMIEGKWKIDRSYKNICIEMMTENLASLRAKADITQGEISNLIGISRQTYYAIELANAQCLGIPICRSYCSSIPITQPVVCCEL